MLPQVSKYCASRNALSRSAATPSAGTKLVLVDNRNIETRGRETGHKISAHYR
jgi:hypothetical protein